jgi:two-component sensor histidine kinase
MKVVMIDDSAADRKLCRLLLEEAHGAQLEFFEAAGAQRGLETCRSVLPDCVLLDYKLPDMTGLEFLSRLRDDTGEDSGVAVVMLTGMASEQVAVDAMKAGAQDYLVKGRITAEGLELAIQKATQKVGLLRALRAERDRLARSLAEKEVLLKEVHHRVKNNLQVVASLLRLQAEAFGDQTLATALRESQLRVESMALIHEELYESGDLREVDLGEHARLLLSNLFHAYGIDRTRIRGHVALDAPSLVLGVDQAIPAGLILNELISNALKHAFPGERSGSLTIEGGLRGGRVVLEVRDDGAGLPEDFRPETPKSLGLQIVRILARQLKGSLEIVRGTPADPGEGGPHTGTLFRISFLHSVPDSSRTRR